MKKRKKITVGAVVGVLVFALAGCSAPAFTLFEDAASSCGGSGIDVEDKGETLTIHMMGDEDWDGASFDEVECVIDNVETPAYIKNSIWSTTALAGRQSDEFETADGAVIEVSWSYHPDNGLDAVFHKTDEK